MDSAHEVQCDLQRVADGPKGIALWERAAANRRGTVILTPGFPPNETGDVLGLGPRLCPAGWRVIQFQPPGSGHSGGSFSLGEIANAIRNILSSVTAAPRILVGHSAGGLFNLAALPFAGFLEGVVTIAAPNGAVTAQDFAANPGALAQWIQQFNAFVGPGQPIHTGDGAAFAAEIMRWQGAFGFESLALRLRDVPALFVAAARDTVAPSDRHLAPLRPLLGAAKVSFQTIDTDHDFTQNREQLSAVILEWLASLPPAG